MQPKNYSNFEVWTMGLFWGLGGSALGFVFLVFAMIVMM